jgi:hypothetical protein
MKRQVLPFLSALFLLWAGVMGASHLLVNVADSMGAFCQESNKDETTVLATKGALSKPVIFETSALCHPTKIRLERGVRYAAVIKMTPETRWANDNQTTSPAGFGMLDVPNLGDRLLFYTTLPQRRVMFKRWFSLLARIGSTGVSEAFLDPEPMDGVPNTYKGMMGRAERSGELFLYVNESVIPLPGLSDAFYRNNRGMAEVVIERLN